MKSFLLTVISFFVVLLILNAGYYKDWIAAKPAQYWDDFLNEKDDGATFEDVRKARYGFSYVLSTKVKEFMDRKRVAHPVVLFEPNTYYRDSLHIQVKVPEPSVFYYYTGLQSVWMNSAGVNSANYLVRVSRKGINIDEIRSQAQLQQILAAYHKFTPIL
jgi:hypothetical protein